MSEILMVQVLAKSRKEAFVFVPILLLFLLISGVLTLIMWQNLNTLTHLNFYFWKTPQLPIGLLLIAAMVFGAVLIYLVALLAATRERRELKRLRQRIVELEGQLQKSQALLPPQVGAAGSLIFQQPTAPLAPQLKMPGMTGPLPVPPRK